MNKTPAVRIIQPICWKSKYHGIKLNFVPVQFVSYQLHLYILLFYRLTLVSACKLIFCTPVNPSFYIGKGKKVKVFERPDTNTIILTPYWGVKKANKKGNFKKIRGRLGNSHAQYPPCTRNIRTLVIFEGRNLKSLKRQPRDLRRRRPDKTARWLN